jgi:RNA polymerase sigma-70 factor (ECF subfamily)
LASPADEEGLPQVGRNWFQDTRWTLVSRASLEGLEGEAALSELCRLAWFPLFSFARRMGWGAEDSEDAVQAFLSSACQKGLFSQARQEKGKLRNFLLLSFKRTLINEKRHRAADRRGGAQSDLPCDLMGLENHYHHEVKDRETPERLYHRQWAVAVLEGALQALKAEYKETGRALTFEVLSPGLEGDQPPGGYVEAGAVLGLTENAARQAMHRLKLAFRRELWRSVALNLGSTNEAGIAQDLEALREALTPPD